MIRNLKVLVAAAMALGALGAVGASSSHAALFHCEAEPCTGKLKPDESSGTKTSHHVFIVENAAKTESVSFTCNSLDGKTTVSIGKTSGEAEFGGNVGAANALVYNTCTVNGGPPATVDMNGCKYNFNAAGAVTITGCTNAAKQIEITISGCTFDIPEQALAGITYHTIGITPNREVTGEANIKSITVTAATGTKAACTINPSQALTGTYTTGNTLATGELIGVMLDGWWL